jgi:putative FmdB family regulatory protein
MPIYEYRRPNGTTFEVRQPMADEPLTQDPDTGVPVVRVLHAPAIHFKGKGFYNTDYGTKRRARELEKSGSDGADKHDAKSKDSSDSKKKDASSSTGSSSSSNSGDSAKKSDSKPASKKS